LRYEIPCPLCGAPHFLSEDEIPPEGARLPCASCGEPIEIALAPPVAGPVAPAIPDRKAAPVEAAGVQVVCPRCGLHFSPGDHRRPAADRPVVLLVEDLEYFVEIARDALGGAYELRVADSVAGGLGVLSEGGIDLLLVDLSLAGGEDGRDLLRALPAKPCPIIALTAQDESQIQGERWTELRTLGVDDLLRKGMQMGEALVRKVGERLGRGQSAS
jgi:CheY-like chemotaxis protein